MTTQTWTGAFRQVAQTLWRYPVIIAVPLAFFVARMPEPWGSRCGLILLVFWFAQGVHLAVRSTQVLRQQRRLLKDLAADCDQLKLLLAEYSQLSIQYVRLYQDGKPDEALIVADQMEQTMKRYAEIMLRSFSNPKLK